MIRFQARTYFIFYKWKMHNIDCWTWPMDLKVAAKVIWSGSWSAITMMNIHLYIRIREIKIVMSVRSIQIELHEISGKKCT